jgi:hypothetical protein
MSEVITRTRKEIRGESEVIRKCVKFVCNQLQDVFKRKDLTMEQGANVMVSLLSSVMSSSFVNTNPFLFVLKHCKEEHLASEVDELVDTTFAAIKEHVKNSLLNKLKEDEISKVVH